MIKSDGSGEFPLISALSEANASSVTVVMPVYNSAKYLSEAIDSVLAQEYQLWNMLVINEFGSDDGSAAIVREYAAKDSRIRLVQNEEKLGLAESLNKGIRMAGGEYIARLDADDIALPARFAKQVAFMDANPDVGVCGTWQEHFGEGKWVHMPPADAEVCKAYLLFWCHMCHSTVMLRKSVFLENGLFYDRESVVEDFELWSRAVAVTKITNLPEVLGKYRRHGEQRVVGERHDKVKDEFGRITARSLKRYVNYDAPAEYWDVLNAWVDVYSGARFTGRWKPTIKKLEAALREIWLANLAERFYRGDALLAAINSKWRWARYRLCWQEQRRVGGIEDVFGQRCWGAGFVNFWRFIRENPTMKGKFNKIYYKLREYLHGGL